MTISDIEVLSLSWLGVWLIVEKLKLELSAAHIWKFQSWNL